MAQLKTVFASRIARNTLSLYLVHVANIILPLATVPFLARVLRPETWGLVALCQAVAMYLSMMVGYGFNTAATRELSRERDNPDTARAIASGVFGAKVILAGVAVVIAVILQRLLPPFVHRPLLFYWGAAWGILTGLSSVWYFQAVEDLQLAAFVEIGSKVVATVLTLLCIRGPKDAWMVLMLLATSSGLADIIEFLRMFRRTGFVFPTFFLIKDALGISWWWFLYDAVMTMSATAGTLIVGTFTTPVVVAWFSGAERITRTVRSSLEPVLRSIFPRLSHLAKHDICEGQRLFELTTLILGVVSTSLAGLLIIFAKVIVAVVLGHGYEQAVPLVRWFAPTIPLYAATIVFGRLWACALGQDRRVMQMMIVSTVLNILFGAVLVRSIGPLGMVVALVISQGALAALYYALLWRIGRRPQCRSMLKAVHSIAVSWQAGLKNSAEGSNLAENQAT